MIEIVLRAMLFLAQQQDTPEAVKPSAVETVPAPTPAPAKRTDLNILGSIDSAAGESRRNENVQFNLIDNNALKYLNIRLGTNATIATEFSPEKKYFGTEFGSAPVGQIHLKSSKSPDDFHGGISFTRSDSLFNARSFFQVGGV